MSMLKLIVSLSLVFFLGTLNAQYDSTWYQTDRYTEILSSEKAQDTVNPINFDIDFLNVCIFHATNEYRIKKGKEALNFDQKLHDLSKKYQKLYENKKFSNTMRYQKRIIKQVYGDAKKVKFKGTLLHANVGSGNILNYNGKRYFYNKREETTDLHLFYGDKPTSKDKNKEREAIPYYTYQELARSIVKSTNQDQNKINNKSKAYKYVGVYCMLDYRTLYKRTIPQLKVITVFGGYQTDLLKEAID